MQVDVNTPILPHNQTIPSRAQNKRWTRLSQVLDATDAGAYALRSRQKRSRYWRSGFGRLAQEVAGATVAPAYRIRCCGERSASQKHRLPRHQSDRVINESSCDGEPRAFWYRYMSRILAGSDRATAALDGEVVDDVITVHYKYSAPALESGEARIVLDWTGQLTGEAAAQWIQELKWPLKTRSHRRGSEREAKSSLVVEFDGCQAAGNWALSRKLFLLVDEVHVRAGGALPSHR